MASMFRKPRRNFRRKVTGSDSDNERDGGDEHMDIDDESYDNVSTDLNNTSAGKSTKEKKKNLKIKEKEPSTKSTLSFDHEEEDTEVFKVKKSSHSKRIAKQLKRERERDEKLEKEEKAKLEKNNPNKRSDSDEERAREEELKKLREELRTLNGDEAEALESSDEDSGPASFRNRLARGEIPDAKTIHFIRKQRQMARQSEDYLPIEQSEAVASKNSSTSRLVRDDEHDKSDEDEDDSRIDFTVNNAATERQKLRDDFLATEHGSDDESEKELASWEDQQIRKAVGHQAPEALLQQHTNGTISRQPDLSAYGPNLARPAVSYHTMSKMPDISEITIESVRKRLQERLDSMDMVYRSHKMELERAQTDMEDCEKNIATCKLKSGDLEERYRFFQEMRGYVRDLVECLNEKVPTINELEQRMHSLLRARAVRLLQRRQQDVRDQCQDYMTNKAAAQVVMETEEEQAKQRRVAEREARRSRRRRARESRNITAHHDGLSSDDEENQADVTKFNLEKENITTIAEKLFEDALEDFSEMDLIRKRFEEWKLQFGDTYREAYISLCIPKLVTPFVKLQLVTWNPLEEGCRDFEDMDWYNSLIFFGASSQREVDPEDTDIKILLAVVEKIILPKLTYLAENIWDPLSTTQSSRLVNLTRRLFRDYPTVHAKSKNSQAYLQAIYNRIKKTLDDDVFMPLYPMSVLDGRSSGPAVFFHRQSWTCIKLLGSILSWHGLLGMKMLQQLALDGLLNRYIVLGLANSHVNRHAMDKCQAIISTLPKAWFAELESDKTLPQLENLCRYLTKAAELVHKSTCTQSDQERQEGRTLIKQMSKQLVTIHAMDHALFLSNQYSFKITS
ncbi:PAX3- and PAX7-binding protein 1-like isoform X2 [Pomacea canaliculata]|uniref:PAX3- and PAX7-binding protein 1-like isoform X2 n=1 Tax=Pomacea canaliculata TaxID=400727 RepID=UPI000D73C165|nr:PAX3- and PAX7-binding protein 1-like isoform X2 [Pomacea canaliculata]